MYNAPFGTRVLRKPRRAEFVGFGTGLDAWLSTRHHSSQESSRVTSFSTRLDGTSRVRGVGLL